MQGYMLSVTSTLHYWFAQSATQNDSGKAWACVRWFLTPDVYTHTEKKEDIEAAQRVGEAIQKAMHSVSLTAIQIKGLPILKSEALAA